MASELPKVNATLTHWDGCWQIHHSCALSRLERTEGLLRDACYILDQVGAGGIEGEARAFLARDEIRDLLLEVDDG